jgi:hypothetical protein
MGFASLFMDMSSELIHSLLPIFMVAGLGASMLTVGIVEGDCRHHEGVLGRAK